ncbi:MAG: DUF1972 domain-containing protein [Candidatus Pseudobacter hemicellulosilyticus]|uniref:DUF1972 domain-containing protein n=1 Tax=Candidatus Pseudobacter hemicellulosilyticus TaxID=3121375 RepID=A0AAJ5WVW7_9BACT|nr:MAG: DUF1972 domain-containing protein [Pseudobacter sp.]
MNIGIIGTRGIPNAYGGFEQFAQYLGKGLVARQHAVTVYNSSDHPYQESQWEGIRLIHRKDWEGKIGTAGQFLYDLNCLRDARKRNFDILLHLGYTSDSIWHWQWPRKAINIVNMDGLEWKRSKYNAFTQSFLKKAEKWAVRHGDLLIADSTGIQQYLQTTYQQSSIFIPYGAELPVRYDPAILDQYQLQPETYYLVIARLEPENNIETIIRGYLLSGSNLPLLIIGNIKQKFGQYLQQQYPDPRIRFIAGIYDTRIIDSLRHYARLYFHGHSVGGTNPSLLEAMACQCTIAAHANPFNQAVLGTDAWYFSNPEAISQLLQQELPADLITTRKAANLQKIQTLYHWDSIIDAYEKVFREALDRRKAGR